MIASKFRWTTLALVAVSLACSGSKEPIGPIVVPVESVTIASTPATVDVGSTVSLSAQVKDAAGGLLSRTVTWTSNNPAVATVSADGTVTGVSAGTAIITATSEGKSATVTINVIVPKVAAVNVSLPGSQLTVGQTAQATATLLDANGRVLTGREIIWSSSQPSIATVDQTGKVTAVALGGPISIVAISEGVSGSAPLTVVAPVSCSNGTLQLAVGEVRTLVGGERSFICLSNSAAEYVLIPFNSSTSSAVGSVRLTATNTAAPLTSLSSLEVTNVPGGLRTGRLDDRLIEYQFRVRERQDLTAALSSFRSSVRTSRSVSGISRITNIPANPVVGSIYPINVSVTGNTCTSAKVLHDARVVGVTTRVIVLIDVQSPANGYTDAELAAFGQNFEALGYDVDTENFGTPTDTDANGRIVILFTPTINALSTQPGVTVGGLQASRDLFPVAQCLASNEGEIFYMPVPDPASTINGNYTNKTSLGSRVQGVLAHEFQHLINAGRRIYVNNANSFETIWLNEGLSHIAEELLYYRVSGQVPRTNIDLATVRSSQAQLDAINSYQIQNLGRLTSYLKATELNSPYAQNDDLETRGATWELLRYAADRKGGPDASTWIALVNSTQSGLANFAGVFGSVTPIVRDWAVAQYTDDLGIPVAANYLYPSWNFRSLLPAINNNIFPLVTRTLTTNPLDLSLVGGGAGYVRFRSVAGQTPTLTATTGDQAPQASIDLILVRTQ